MSHSQGERERARKNNEKREEPDEKCTCDRSSERGERKREPSFSYGKCFFPTKVPFYPVLAASLLASGMFHIQQEAALPCHFPQCSKTEAD